MLAEKKVLEGQLDEALSDLKSHIRKDPSNAKYRVFLFQLLAVFGDWDRAMTQLHVAADLDDGNLVMKQMYQEALQCEALRDEIYQSGKHSPLLFGKPERWLALLVEALRLSNEGKQTEAQNLREEAFELAPQSSGKIDDKPFEWIADADTRMGPVLETIINGRYYWMPFHHLKNITIEKPEDLRDTVWMPAHFTFTNGGESVGLIPTRYAGSQRSEDPQIIQARLTSWIDQGEGLFIGQGQRLLTTDKDEYALMDIRKIEFDVELSSHTTSPE